MHSVVSTWPAGRSRAVRSSATSASREGLPCSWWWRGKSHQRTYRCLNASLAAVYDVPQCVGPLGFNYSRRFQPYSVVSLVVALNASFGGALAPFAEGAGCEALLGATGDSRGSDTAADGRGARIDELFRAPSLPPLPRFHPCASALNGARVERLRLLATRARHYVSHTVVALSPDIGPVAGGVSIGVCGFGFSQANGRWSPACRFTDGTNRVDTPAMYVDQNQLVTRPTSPASPSACRTM